MDWLEADWTQERPADAATERMWQSVDVRPLDEIPVAVSRYLDALRRIYVNGGVQFARFAATGNQDFHWFATHGRWHEIAFFSRLLAHPAVQKRLPDVTREARRNHTLQFEWGSSLTLDGELARLLVSGGAYLEFTGHPREAKQLGAQVCEALFGDRYLEVEVFHCWSAWSAWFHDVAWDSTFVLIDRRLQEISLLCATDTD